METPKKKDKNKGINRTVNGIKLINLSSCVNEIDIQ